MNPLFEAYRLLHTAAPKSDRLQQVLTILRCEIEQDGSRLIYEDPATGELRLLEALPVPAGLVNARRATLVVRFRRPHA